MSHPVLFCCNFRTSSERKFSARGRRNILRQWPTQVGFFQCSYQSWFLRLNLLYLDETSEKNVFTQSFSWLFESSCLLNTHWLSLTNTRTLTHTHPENKTHTYTHKTHTHTQTLNTRDVDAPFSSPWSNMKSQLDAPVHKHARKKKATAEKRKKYPKMEKIFFQWMIHLFYRLKQWLWFNPVRSGVYSTQLCFTRF